MKKENNTVDNFFGKGQKMKVESSIRMEPDKFNSKDDLTKINGVGPVIVSILKKEGVATFSQLANVDIKKLQNIVAEVRGSHEPTFWIKQAKEMTKKTTSNKVSSREINIKKAKIKNSINKIEKNVEASNRGDRRRNERQNKSVNTFVAKEVPRMRATPIKADNGQNRGVLLSIANTILMVLFLSIGLFFTNQTFQGIDFEKSVFFYLSIALAAGLTVVQFLLQRNIKIRKTPFDKVLFAFILMYGVSVVFSVDRWHSFVGFFSDPSRGFIFMAIMVVSFYLILSNFTTQTAKKALGLIVTSIILLSVYTLISGLGLIPSNIQVFIPFSLVGSLRGLTTVLSVGVPLLAIVYLSLRDSQYKKRAMLSQGIILMSLMAIVIDLIMLKAFVSWIALAGGVIVLIFLLANKNGKKIGGIFGRKAIFTILAVLILLTGWAKSDYHTLMPTFAKIGLPTEVQVGLPVSYEVVKNSLGTGWKQMLIGSGPATFGYDFAKFSPKGLVSPVSTIEYLYQGKGIIAEAMPTIGLGGTILIILLGVSFVMRALKVLSTQSEVRVQFIGLFAASTMLLMNEIVNRINGGLLFFSVLILGLTVFFMLNNSKDEKYYSIDLKGLAFSKFIGVLMMVGVLIGLLFGGVSVTRAYLADIYFSQALLKKDVEMKNNKIIKAIKIRPEEGVYYTKLGQTFLMMLDEERKTGEKIDAQKMEILKKNTIGYVEKGARLMTNDVKTQRFLATIYEMTGIEDVEKVRKIYENIIELDPNNIQYYVKMGDLYLLESKKDNKDEKLTKALEWYKKALNIQPRESAVYDRIATVFYQKEELDQAMTSIANAIKLSPKDTSYKFTLGVLYQLKGGKEEVVVAEKIFKTLLVSTPRNIDVLTQLGLLYEQTGHIDEAKKQYEQIITMLGDEEKFEKIKEVFKKFITNLNDGKLNIKKKEDIASKLNDIDINKQETVENTEAEKSEENKEVLKPEEEASKNSDEAQKTDNEEVTVTVGEEGPINVRGEGSLTGEKLTKIKETKKFEKIGENEKWVQILIPASEGQEEMRGWVHRKFITE